MGIAALFPIAKIWIQPRCSSTDEWTGKLWFIDTAEYYSVIKKNEVLSFAKKWVILEEIMLRKLSHTQKDKHV
jgi:hypothetical protein